jgi:DNA-dependent RNA polymerase auxiliary subunit epsilon
MNDKTENIYRLMLVWKQYKSEDDDDCLVRDLLADLMHFCDEYAIDFFDELESAKLYYKKEVGHE